VAADPALASFVLGPTDVAAGDFDGDGKQDLAVLSGGLGSDAYVNILLGNGDGSFQAPMTYPTGQTTHLILGDFNADGALDLAVNSVELGVKILVGDGDGTLTAVVIPSLGAFANQLDRVGGPSLPPRG